MPVSPPRPKSPPLNALRAFEAAARLGGFLAAAEELGVTPGAVSQQIKTLEGWAGAALFERRAQGVVLTRLGADVAGEFARVFDAIGDAARQLRGRAARTTVTIAALPSVAQLWLAPRLPAIRAALPGVEISVSALEQRPNLRREMFDLALFLDRPRGTPEEVIIRADRICAVCAPTLARQITAMSDLGAQTWLYDATWAQDWQIWAAQAAPGLALQEGPRHSLYGLALGEAVAGAGILIGHECLVESAIGAGDLVAIGTDWVATDRALTLETAPVAGAVVRDLARVLIATDTRPLADPMRRQDRGSGSSTG